MRPARGKYLDAKYERAAGSIVKFPQAVMHDVRNLGPERCVIMFLKVNPKVLKGQHDG